MHHLATAIPDADVLLALEPEELAGKILLLLRTQPGNGMFNPYQLREAMHNNTLSGRSPYPTDRRRDVDLALIEAYAWLEAQGLIIPTPDGNSANGWRCLSRRAQRFENEAAFADYRAAQLLPKELLHPAIATTVWLSFMRGAYPTAVFEAMRAVEIAVRDAAGFAQSEHGVPMIRKAFNPKGGPLADPAADEGEREALSALFAGAIGSYKNPHSHRHVPIDTPREAVEIILLASHLLGIVDARVAALQVAA